MRTLFIGGTRRGYLALKTLIDSNAEVVGILSLAQDSHELEQYGEPIRALAESGGISIRETKFVRGPEWAAWAEKDLQAEVAFAIGVRVLLPRDFYSVFAKGCWAVHDSLLPEYRGFAPLNWAIINDERETGVTLFRVSEKMDGGEILLQQRISIGPDQTAPELYQSICEASSKILLAGHELLRQGVASPRPQDYEAGSFTASRTPSDGLIDWSQATRHIYNLVRALTFPYPGAFTFLQGRRIFVLSSRPVPDAPRYVGRIPGRVVQIHGDEGVDVLTGDGLLRIIEVSADGVSRQNAADVIRSVRLRLGLDLTDLAARLARLEEQAGMQSNQ